MKGMLNLNVENVIGHKVLIVGDVGTGKTKLTAKLLEKLLAKGVGKVTVIDLAPSKALLGEVKVGSRLEEYTPAVKKTRYLVAEGIRAPRLEAKSAHEVKMLVDENRKLVMPIFKEYAERPSKVLIINDLSIFFHFGNLEEILMCMNMCKTFVANAYYGEKLKEDYGTSISMREKTYVERLMKLVDLVIRL